MTRHVTTQHPTVFRPVRRLSFLLLLATVAFMSPRGQAQTQPASRIAGNIDASSQVALHGTVSPHIRAAVDQGRVSGNLKLTGLTLVFTQSAAQRADLKQLLVDQQTPGSSSYHAWLTPAQYAARFGMSDADIAKVQSWLTGAGFSVTGVSNSRTRMTFSGTATQVESAFSTELHNYRLNGETHLANATELKIPSALSGMVVGVSNISDFRPKPRVRPTPKYTSSQTGSIFTTPADLSVIYDIAPLYAAGYTGTGQRIAVAGQSEVELADIANFRSAANLTAKAPIPVLVPGTGDAAVSSGDEVESDIDLEYSGAVAQNADIYFVYTGSSQNYGVFDALTYAVDTNLAPVISVSYGECEADLATADFNTLEAVFQQAISQGQTVFSAAGDSGATDCDDSTNPVITTATHGLAVDYPAASQYVTGVGGTMFNDTGATSTYWSTTNTASGDSALSYIPEEAWNETAASIAEGGGLTGGGGGASILTTKPSWQTGTGVPADGHRDVPDIALDAAAIHEPYLYCSSDTTATGVTGSCTDGFRDANDTYLTTAGGTSFGAPIAAGIMALVNQKTGSAGHGNLNPMLYSLAATTPAAFHDITVGNNSQPCTVGTTDCTSSPIGFSAGVGYDQATGLGTLDANVFAGAFPAATTSSLIATTVSLSPVDTSVTANTATTITATVVGSSGTGTPTGTVLFSVATSLGGAPLTSTVSLTGSVATYTIPAATLSQVGSYVVSATYSGDSTYATSYGVDTVTVTPPVSTGAGTIALASTAVTTPLGGSGTSTITLTPAGGYTGTVNFTLNSSSTLFNEDGCYTIGDDSGDVSVTGTAAVTTTLTVYTTTAVCSTADTRTGKGLHRFRGAKVVASNRQNAPRPGFPAVPVSAAAVAGALCLLGARKRSRLWMLVAVVLLSGAALSSVGCGGSSGTPIVTSTEVPAGTYTLTLVGTDTTYSSITASTTITLTVQ